MKQESSVLRQWLIKAYLRAAELLYGRFAWAYDLVARLVSFGYWSRWQKDALVYLKPGQTLETGCGTGTLLIEMTRLGYDVIGLELSAQMHRVMNRKLHGIGTGVKRLQGKSGAIPFADASFVNVLSTFPSGYVFEDETLREVHRVLRMDGVWVIVGLGAQFKSTVKHGLTNWILGDLDEARLQTVAEKICQSGFAYTLFHHETPAYTLPVLVLEKTLG